MGYKSKFYQSGAHLDDTKYVHPKSSWDFSKQEQTATEKTKDSTNKKQTELPSIKTTISPINRKTNRERIDLGQNEGKIGEGWQNRVNTEALVGQSYKDTAAYYDRLIEKKKQQFEAVKPDSNFLPERQRLRYEIDRLEQEREAIANSGKRGSISKEGAGGFGSNSELHINPRSPMQTVADTIAYGAGVSDIGALKAADFLANAIPRAAGAIRGVDPESTFTGQLFKPITDATGQAVDWMQRGVENKQKNIDNDVKDNKLAKIATEIGSGVISALPNAALAMMTGGASAGGAIGSQLAPQATGLSGTILSAWNKMVSSPMFQVSFAQTLGNSYDEAKQAGASDMDAMAAALLSTTANAMVEAGGGIETLPGELSGADLSSGKKALKWMTSALDEGKEEVVQGVISNMVNKAAGTDNRPYFSMTDENAVLNPYRMGQEFGMGAAIGGIMGGGQVLADTVMNRSKAKKSALDFAIEETLKPTQEQTNLDRALEGLFEQNKTAQPIETESDVPLLLPEQSEITKERGYPYSRKDAVYKVVEIPQEKVAEIEAYINTVDSTTARKKYKRILKNLFSGQRFTNANTVANEIAYEIGIGSKGIGEIIARQPVNAQTLAMLEQLNEVVENAKYVASEPTSHPERSAVKRTDLFETETLVGDQPGKAKMRVNVTDQGNKLYFATNETKEAQSPQPRNGNPEHRGIEGTASYSDSIRGNSENVNGNTDQFDVGDLGAKTSDFQHEVKQSQTAENTIGKNEKRWGVPKDQRVNGDYDAVTERESLNNARMRIEQDLPGEMENLRRAATWSNEEVDMGMLILGGLRAQAKESGDWSQYREWASVVKQHGVTSGQALQAWAKYTRKTGDGIMQRVSELLDNAKKGTNVDDILETASDYADRFDGAVASQSVGDLVSIIKDTAVTRKTKRNWGRKLGGQIDWALNRIAAYAESEISQAVNNGSAETMQFYEFLKNFAAASIENIAADQQKVSAGKMVMTIRRNGMLSKFSTIMRNLVGNGVFDIADSVSRDISVPLDMLLSKITGTRSVAMDYGYLSKAKRKGMMDGLAMAMLETSLDVNARERSSKYESGSQRTFKMSGNVVSKLLSSWESAMGYGLYVTDEMAKGATSSEIQRGLDRLYEKGKIRDDSLRSGGEQEALYRTFQDETLLSDISIGARNVLNKAHVGDVGLGDVALPFAQVPANLADRAIDYSPAGLTKTAVRLVDVLVKAKKGTLTAAEQAKAVQTLGRNITGTVLIAVAAGLAANGVIRVVNPGDEDESKDQAAFEKMQGQYGTQLNLSAAQRVLNGGSGAWQNGDTLMSIAFLEPFNAHLTIGAMLAEDMEEEGQLTAKTIANDTFAGSLSAILDLPMFEKFRDVSDAFTYSDKERTGEKLLDAANTLAANEVGSMIPNFAKGIAQGIDPYQRDLYSKEGAWSQAADQFRAVFDRDSLPIKQDSFGRDMRNEGGALNFLNANILPGQITRYKTDDLTDKITGLADTTGKTSVYPSRKAPDKITVDGEDIPLTQEQQRQYQSTYGKTEYDTRNALIKNDLYDNLTPQEELKAHAYAEDYAKQVAKSEANSDFEPEKWVAELKGKSTEEIGDAIMLKTFQSMAEDKKKYDSKYDGIASMLESGNIDEAMAVSMLPKEAEDGYFNQINGSGIEISTFIDVYQFKTDARSDYDKDGKTVKSAQEKVIEYINRVEKSPEKKRRLFLSMGYAESKIPEEWK